MTISDKAWARGALLMLAAALAGVSLTGLLIWRGHVNAAKDARNHQVIVTVCARVHRLDLALQTLVADNSTRKALLRTAYYRQHPDELQQALDHAKVSAGILRRADCSAAEIAAAAAATTP